MGNPPYRIDQALLSLREWVLAKKKEYDTDKIYGTERIQLNVQRVKDDFVNSKDKAIYKAGMLYALRELGHYNQALTDIANQLTADSLTGAKNERGEK